MSCDLVLIGVGGQGILTIGEILLEAALAAGVPASFLPTKGMAQRGGFVVAELRLGAEGRGPRVGDRGAELVVAMERSEALKGIRYARPGGEFLLYDHVWEPTGVLLGHDSYPSRDDVVAQIAASGAGLRLLRPDRLPVRGDRPVSANIYVLGAAMARPALASLLSVDGIEQAISARWPKVSESNLFAFRSGLALGRPSLEDRRGTEDADVVG
jgi:indolepyruvate ferredoxin oxidoreductase beta subunit